MYRVAFHEIFKSVDHSISFEALVHLQTAILVVFDPLCRFVKDVLDS